MAGLRLVTEDRSETPRPAPRAPDPLDAFSSLVLRSSRMLEALSGQAVAQAEQAAAEINVRLRAKGLLTDETLSPRVMQSEKP